MNKLKQSYILIKILKNDKCYLSRALNVVFIKLRALHGLLN